MLYTEQNVRDNIRTREGKRVFYLREEDRLTSAARDYLRSEHIEILPAQQAKPDCYRLENGAILLEKPEHMTHLQGNVLVSKTHPRILFRGKMDLLEAEFMLCQLKAPEFRNELGELLAFARYLLRCEILGEVVDSWKLMGLSPEDLRKHSHFPQDHYGQPHFMPQYTDGEEILHLNRLRCIARQVELAAVNAFADDNGKTDRADLLQALNRLSSAVYILMIRKKAQQTK